jgi:hypothetical protein
MRKVFLAEQSNTIYTKELLAIVTAFKHWARYLQCAEHQIEVCTDYKNLEYFKTIGTDQQQLAQWAIKLKEINYRNKFIKAQTNSKADTLTRSTYLEADKTLPHRVISN